MSTTHKKRALLQQTLTRLVGEQIDFANLSEDGLEDMLRSIAIQLGPFYADPGVTPRIINNAFDKTDACYHTFLRLWQVFSNVLANRANISDDNPDSSFNHAIHTPGVAMTLSVASVFPAIIGAAMAYGEEQIGQQRNTLTHIKGKIQKVIKNQSISEKEILARYNSLLQRGKIAPLPRYADRDIATIQTVFPDSSQATAITQAAKNPLAANLRAIWNFLADTALVFWPAWMIASLIVGVGAASALPVLPILVSIAFGTTAIIKGITAYVIKPLADQNTDANAVAELAHLRQTAAIRMQMKYEHNLFKSTLGVANAPKAPKATEPVQYTAVISEGSNKTLLFIAKSQAANRTATLGLTSTDLTHIKQSTLYKQLLGNPAAQRARIAITVINTFVSQYTLASFILWLTGSTLLTLAPIATSLGAISGIVLGAVLPAISTAFSGLMGSIYGVSTFADLRTKQIALERKTCLRLAEKYAHTNKNKLTIFNEFMEKIAQNRALVEQKQNDLRQTNDLTATDRAILNYDLNKFDVYNDHYFRHQAYVPSTWEKIKSRLFITYKAMSSGQTWIFVARSLFLAGSVAGGISLFAGPAAGIAFIAIAATLAIIGITLRVSQMHLDTKMQENEFFIDTLDERISYLKKENKRLNWIISPPGNANIEKKPLPLNDTHLQSSPACGFFANQATPSTPTNTTLGIRRRR